MLVLAACLGAQAVDNAFFEAKIRPVLAAKCYACHSSKLKAPMAGLVLDTKSGIRKGGVLGPAVVPGKPGEGHLLRALSFRDSHLQMPPTGKLADDVLADFRRWVEGGAPDPRADSPAPGAGPLRGMPVAEGRNWWAFQPLRPRPRPRVARADWPRTKIDAFVLQKLEAVGLAPSPPADPRTLVRRAYVDLVGYKPSYEEVEAFAASPTDSAYAELVDRLLASPHHGERWGRHWLDVARFAEDNPTSEATNPPYPFAWRYRDWVIEAINRDVPYDRFVKLQLAADKLPGTPRSEMRALGYLGTAPIYHKDQRLSAEVIGGFMADDWDDRVDAVTRGILGLTVACARCHDHKFDPITTRDYYGLVGVFASTMRAERPLFEVDSGVESRYLWVQRRLFDLRYSINLLTGEASTVVNSPELVARWKPELESLAEEWKANQERHPQLVKSLERYWAPPQQNRQGRRGPVASTEPFMNAVYDAAQYVDGSEPNYTFINYKPGEFRDFPVLLNGNVATPGAAVPRKFLSVLSRGDEGLHEGSGRRELAERIFADSGPLAARVIVNRAWGWHFGKPLVATTSDFGTQGDKPTHADLLEDLAARFVDNGWSLKWLHREILLSAAYRQSSAPRRDAQAVDQGNALLWRMNPRRLDVEAYRDTLLRLSGRLDAAMCGPSEDVDSDTSVRRTVYGRVARGRMSKLLQLYDFPDPSQTSPGRDLTTSALQSLFVLNSSFMKASAEAAASKSADARELFRRILGRDPSSNELDAALTMAGSRGLETYARILMSTNEVIFWP
jgi:hypothetical protein